MKPNNFKLILLMVMICKLINAQEAKILTKHAKVDTMHLNLTDKCFYAGKEFRIQLNKNHSSTVLPKIGNNKTLVLVDKEGQILNYNIIEYELGFNRNGSFVNYKMTDNIINFELFKNIEVGKSVLISSIIYMDLTNSENKKKIDSFEIKRIK